MRERISDACNDIPINELEMKDNASYFFIDIIFCTKAKYFDKIFTGVRDIKRATRACQRHSKADERTELKVGRYKLCTIYVSIGMLSRSVVYKTRAFLNIIETLGIATCTVEVSDSAATSHGKALADLKTYTHTLAPSSLKHLFQSDE